MSSALWGSSLGSLRIAPIGRSIRYLFIIIVECLHGALPYPLPFPRFASARTLPLAFARVVPGQSLAAPSRSRRGHKYNKQTLKTFNTCATIVPTPTPSPARARPFTTHRFRSGRARPDCSLPPPAPGGGINTISKPSKPSTPAPPSSLPPPLPPLRAWPSTSLRFRSGSCPSRLLAAPSRSRRGLLITPFHTFQHNYCMSAPYIQTCSLRI